jgi:hypothetical protein
MIDLPFQWWVTPARARYLGCTHHARLLGCIPGFVGDLDHPDGPRWISRSDALIPLEDLCGWIAATIARMRGDEPLFWFAVGHPIEKGRSDV